MVSSKHVLRSGFGLTYKYIIQIFSPCLSAKRQRFTLQWLSLQLVNQMLPFLVLRHIMLHWHTEGTKLFGSGTPRTYVRPGA
jgi:hypothetical protein